MKYDVHLFTVVRVKVCNVEADSHVEAAKKAAEQTDMYSLFSGSSNGITTEWGEEHSHALVDVVGDTDFAHSKWLNRNLTRPLNFNRPRPKKKG